MYHRLYLLSKQIQWKTAILERMFYGKGKHIVYGWPIVYIIF